MLRGLHYIGNVTVTACMLASDGPTGLLTLTRGYAGEAAWSAEIRVKTRKFGGIIGSIEGFSVRYGFRCYTAFGWCRGMLPHQVGERSALFETDD